MGCSIKMTRSLPLLDCAPETGGRHNLCYDEASPERGQCSAVSAEVAKEMGVELLDEEYRFLRSFGLLDQKSSSWIRTPRNATWAGAFRDWRWADLHLPQRGAVVYSGRGFRTASRARRTPPRFMEHEAGSINSLCDAPFHHRRRSARPPCGRRHGQQAESIAEPKPREVGALPDEVVDRIAALSGSG